MLAFGDLDPPPTLSEFEIIPNKLIELFSSVADKQTQSIQNFLMDPESTLRKAIETEIIIMYSHIHICFSHSLRS
jgi:hypothetical protein